MSAMSPERAATRRPIWSSLRQAPALWRSGIVGFLGKSPIFEQRRTEFGLWWGKRSPRERRLLLALSLTAALALLVAAVYRPLAATRAQAVADIRTYDVLIAQLRTAGPELGRLRSLNRGDAPALVSSSAAGYGLVVAGLRSNQGVIQLSFENAEFTRIVQWLAQIESTSALRLRAITLRRQPAPGIVNARIALSQ